MNTAHLIYFSPAFSTRKIIRLIGENIDLPVTEHDITQGITESLAFGPDDLAIFGIPVYAGRVPPLAVDYLEKVKGDATPAVLVAVYGNRDYDDALLELKHIVEANNFNVIGAGAFIARHSIFPQVATERPDEADRAKMIEFTRQCVDGYTTKQENNGQSLIVKGNMPYREPSAIPFAPRGDKKCNRCGTCVSMCPVTAIPEENPRKTDKKVCIACARCIAVCPQKARHFGGLLYRIVTRKFVSAYGVRKEPETFVLL